MFFASISYHTNEYRRVETQGCTSSQESTVGVPRLRLYSATQRIGFSIAFMSTQNRRHTGDIYVRVMEAYIDHSAFDAFMLLVRAGDEYILHTGDFRDHGHKGKKSGDSIIIKVINHYIRQRGLRNINALILEGTMMSRSSERRYSEKDMLRELTEESKNNKYVFLKISSTNVDSLASFGKAAERNGMKMYVGQYLQTQIDVYRAVGTSHGTDMYSFSNVLPYLPCPDDCTSDIQRNSSINQRRHMRQDGFVILVSEKGNYKKIVDEFYDLPTKTYYSMWKGYITPGSSAFNEELYNFCEYTHADTAHYTSGHA